MAGTVARGRLPSAVHLAGEVLDWAVVAGAVALLGWVAREGLTFMPSAGYRAHLVPLWHFERDALLLGAAAVLRRLLGGRAVPKTPLVALAAANVVGLLSVAHTTDLYGTREMVGFLLAVSVLAVALLGSLNDAAKTTACLSGAAAVAVGEAVLGLVQYARGIPTPSYWLGAAFAGVIHTRVYGTLSSPNVLAGFLILGTAAAAVLASTLPGPARVGALAGVAVQVWAMALTYSRGGYAGLLVFLLVASVFLWPVRRRAWPAVALAALVAGSAAVALPEVGLRAHSLAPAQEDTAASRLFIWRTALRVWRAHPLWGTGLGSFNAVYSPYRPPGVLATYAMLAVPGSAHDDYLQVLVETGLAGAVFLGAVGLGVLARAGLRYARAGPEGRVWLAVSGAGVLGLGAMSVVDENLYVVSTLVLLVVVASATACHVSLPDRGRSRPAGGLFFLPLLPVVLLLPPVLAAPVRASVLHDQATREVREGRYLRAVATFQAALRADPLNGVVPAYFGDLLADLYIRRLDTPLGPWPTLRDRAAQLYLLAIRRLPYNPYPYAELGRLLRMERRPREATAALEEAVRLDPYTPRYRLWLAEALEEAGDRPDAVAQLEEAVRLFPVELLVIDHHEGHSPRYLTEVGLLARARADLARLRSPAR